MMPTVEVHLGHPIVGKRRMLSRYVQSLLSLA